MPLTALLDRERSILQFNQRVLAQARRPDVPLLERLRYVTIVSSNLDEFFEVRMAELLEAAHTAGGAAAQAQLTGVAEAARSLIAEQYAVFNDEVMPGLAREGIVVLNHAERDQAQRQWVDDFFHREVRPLLMPVSLDPSHPFPQVANKSLNFIARLSGRDAFGRSNAVAIVKVPRALPRVIRLPDTLCGGRQGFVLLTSVMRAHLGELFPHRRVEAFSQFRVTRDSDLEVPTCARRCAAGCRAGTSAAPSGSRWSAAAHPSWPTSCCSSSNCRRLSCTAWTDRSTWCA